MVNQCIDMSYLTQNTYDHFTIMMTLWKFSPFTFLVGLFFYIVEIGRGSTIPASRFWAYFRLLLLSITCSLVFLMGYGLICDVLDANIVNAQIQLNVSPVYDSSYPRFLCIQAVYLLSSVIGWVGTLLFMIFPLTSQTDFLVWGEFSKSDLENNAGEYVTQFQNSQF